jgi:hypothetical protein
MRSIETSQSRTIPQMVAALYGVILILCLMVGTYLNAWLENTPLSFHSMERALALGCTKESRANLATCARTFDEAAHRAASELMGCLT